MSDDHRQSTPRSRVAIIGGGIAGLSAAMALSRIASRDPQSPRFEVILLESRKATGGRAGSFTDPVSGATADYCQHVAMGCCTNFIDLIDEAGLTDCFTRYDELSFYHPATGISPFRANRFLPAPLHLNSALSGLRYLTWRQKLSVRRGLWSLMRTSEADLADVTAARWLADHGQDAETRQRFWDVILVSALGDVPQRVSMAAARKVMIDGFASVQGASDVWVPNEPLSQIFGERLISVLRKRGVDVRLQTSVRNIQTLEQSSSSPRARVTVGDGECLDVDHVILATSWRAASRLIDAITVRDEPETVGSWQRSLADTLGSVLQSPITGLHLWFDRSLTTHRHVVMVGTTAHWLFHHGLDPQNPAAGHYHQIVISGRHRLSDEPKEILIDQVIDELRQAFPNANDAVLLNSRVVTDPAAVYSVTPAFDTQRPVTQTPLPWLHLAGDYVQTGWPGTMEGATISGRLAAESVLGQFNDDGTPAAFSCVLPGLQRRWLARLCIRD
ncbi:hydroxysqualene dehydroxylase HpnE [Aporhodopirellula aestuarii]|uniref:Hydroxysqualene dehydroxylase HpnE n=1 Tax=Aporhodopirellula aestuarii TaxID=2950107 RepID=A0ABT0U8U3_9BACT|nr:hydroxysqualene dehydroxylase HpnE [Aporhodopirellula aestuarii]MCM2373378.1 hydroxysqualene dehydroxylase HpnE [Aporhodopirellula aestuarii]